MKNTQSAVEVEAVVRPRDWPRELDAALLKNFGADIQAETTWNVVYGGYVTSFETNDSKLRQRINAFIQDFMRGVEVAA